MNTVLYSGRLWRHKRSFLGGDQWKECWIVLREDGQLVVYNDKHCSKVINRSLNIITVKAGLHIGTEALSFHRADRPAAPFGNVTIDTLYFTLPKPAKNKSASKPWWFYFKSERDLIGWLRAFAKAIGKERVYDAVLGELREEEERQLREELEATDTPPYKELFEISSSGLSIRGETYRQKRGERDFTSIWTRVVQSPAGANDQAATEQSTSMAGEHEALFRERLASESPSTSDDDMQPADNGYDTLTTEERSQDSARPIEVIVKADVHSQDSELPQPPVTREDQRDDQRGDQGEDQRNDHRDDQSSSGRASDEDDPIRENTEHVQNPQPTAT